MSPISVRNRIRTRSVSRADAADISMRKSSLRLQHPHQLSLVDDDTIMTKRELARSIAEFRVGYSPSSMLTNESTGVDSVENNDDDEPKQLDTYIKCGLAPVNDRSLTTSPPVNKDKCYEATPRLHHTQTSNTIQYSSQATQPDDNESVLLEERTSRHTGSHRRGFTSSERELLEAAFHIADNPGTATMKLLVHLTGLDKKKIRGWFRTRRIRQEREDAKVQSSENTTPSMTESKHQVPPQYWPEPLRFSHMQRPYPVPGYNYRAPAGLPQKASGVPSMMPGIPSKVQPGYLYPPLPPATTMGILPTPPPPPPPPPLGHWYPPLGFNNGLPPQPTVTKNGQLSSRLPAVSQATPSTGTPTVPTGPWYPSPGIGHPLQGVILPTVPTSNAPSGLLPGGLFHPWSSVGCYAAPGVTSYLPHPAVPYGSPWYPMLPAPNTQTPTHRQSEIQSEASMMSTASTSQSLKPLPSKVTSTIQEISETDAEASSSA